MPPGRSTRRISTQAGLVVRQVAEAEGHRDQVERRVAQGQAQGVGFEKQRPGRAARRSCRARRPAWDGRNRCRAPGAPLRLASASTRSPVPQQISSTRASGRSQNCAHAAHGAGAPVAVDVEGEQVVGQIVAVRHAAEHAADPVAPPPARCAASRRGGVVPLMPARTGWRPAPACPRCPRPP